MEVLRRTAVDATIYTGTCPPPSDYWRNVQVAADIVWHRRLADMVTYDEGSGWVKYLAPRPDGGISGVVFRGYEQFSPFLSARYLEEFAQGRGGVRNWHVPRLPHDSDETWKIERHRTFGDRSRRRKPRGA